METVLPPIVRSTVTGFRVAKDELDIQNPTSAGGQQGGGASEMMGGAGRRDPVAREPLGRGRPGLLPVDTELATKSGGCPEGGVSHPPSRS